MEILRIPRVYQTQVEYLTQQDSEYVLKTIFKLAMWEDIKIEKSMRWWLVLSIWREAIQMENKARAKKWKERLNEDVATLMADTVGTVTNQNSATKSSQIKSNQVKSNQEKDIVVATKVATLEDLIKQEIDISFFVENYNSSLDKIKKELREFYLYWSEKKPNWKKEKWEMQKTFDVWRRFHKRLWNASNWNRSKTNINSFEDIINIT